MRETQIRMYLMYWFACEQAEDEVSAALSRLGLEGCRFFRGRADNCGAEFPSVCRQTRELQEVTAEFLEWYSDKTDALNAFSALYPGTYVIEIVPEFCRGKTPALSLERDLLDFTKKLDKFERIDIDQYIL